MQNGQKVTEKEFLKGTEGNLGRLFRDGTDLCGQHSTGWPFFSNSMAVHPAQVKEAVEQARAKGVATEFNEKGQPKITDPGHRLKLAKALGMVDLTSHEITRVERD